MTRELAIKILSTRDNQGMPITWQNGFIEAYDLAIEALERKRGEWVVLYDEDSPQDGIWKCSLCDYIRLTDDISPTNFCPNCGAEMKND